MAVAQCAAAVGAAMIALHAGAAAIAAYRCRKRKTSPPPSDRPPVSIVRPLCGADPFLAKTLASTFDLDYPRYEIIFCVARADDPAAARAQRLIAARPATPARLLIGRSE